MSAPQMVGQSKVFQKIVEDARRVAIQGSPVCLLGESGTGKELFARLIHSESPRSAMPFEPLSCGAISKDIVGSELFGHERGAFTGANKLRKGVFERACDGTVFLDEIGTLPMELQTQFLRVLEEKKVVRLGGEREINTNFGLISATNESLMALVETDRFRLDLFYRLAGVVLNVPPLREREGDIPLLANFYRRRQGKEELDDATWAVLAGYDWPGNVRELRCFIEHLNCAYVEVVLDTNVVAEALVRFKANMPKPKAMSKPEKSETRPFESFDVYMIRLGIQADDFGTAACSIAQYLLRIDSGKRVDFLGERCAMSEDAFVVPLLADAVSLTCLVLAESEGGIPMEIAGSEFGLNRMRRKSVCDLAAIERAIYQRLKNASI
jgi:transcriptional regulator with PAS, ATPase and Fis domain